MSCSKCSSTSAHTKKKSVDLKTFIPDNIIILSFSFYHIFVYVVRPICSTEMLYFYSSLLTRVLSHVAFIKIEIQVCYVNVYNTLSLSQSNITLRKYHCMVGRNIVKSRVHHNVVKMSYTLVFSRALHIAIFFTIVVSSLKEKFTVLK